MPYHQVAWPAWTREEDTMFIYLSSRGIELPDVARIISYKLHRPARSIISLMNRMDRINQHRAQRHLPSLCERGMANWDQGAVEDFLINSTWDTELLQDLLWFHTRYIPLLRTWLDQGIPLDLVLDVSQLQLGLAMLIQKHRMFYGYPSQHGRRPSR